MKNLLQTVSQLRHPVLRHLLWLAQAAQLIRGEAVFEPWHYLKQHWLDRHWDMIRTWDADSTLLPPRLAAEPKRLLGLYVEELYHSLLEDLLGWRVVARNIPVHGEGRTIGEMDFLVENPATGRVEHHEIAIKFYLGYPEGSNVHWYGPNPADRLDLKTQRMLSHQSQLSARPEALPRLHSLGIHEGPESRVFMPGYLFYPVDQELNTPSQADPDHARGLWLFIDQLNTVSGLDNFMPLEKPNWLGPWFQKAEPDAALVTRALAEVEARRHPRLFAQLEWNEDYQLWVEQQRYFVVPRSWPGN